MAGEDAKAVDVCHRNGWLHTDKFSDRGEIVYFFASQFHHLFVEWKLQEYVSPMSFESSNILDFAIKVIAGFSPRSLSAKRRIGPGYIQRLPEAQYQDEFYRSCYKLSNGSLVTLSEYGGAEGRVDFYIPSKEWGVELLRDGKQLGGHSARFSSTGQYGRTLSLSDHIILDCRTTKPKTAHSMCIICPSIHFSNDSHTPPTTIVNDEHLMVVIVHSD